MNSSHITTRVLSKWATVQLPSRWYGRYDSKILTANAKHCCRMNVLDGTQMYCSKMLSKQNCSFSICSCIILRATHVANGF